MSALQDAMLEYMKSIQPPSDKSTVREIDQVRRAITESAVWQDFDEWRISTSFDCSIKPIEVNGKSVFHVRVECDGQEFKCNCPTVEKAVFFSKLYRRLIVDQFYSIGPPWA